MIKNIIIATSILTTVNIANAYEAHEWGTFTSVVGSDGKIIQGLHHEEEALPNFVYDLSRVEQVNAISLNPFGRDRGGSGGGGGIGGGGPVTRGFFPQSMDLMPIPTFTERITQKMETPVIYFYTDKKIDVNVRVDFPNGVISQWYPKAAKFNPSKEAKDGYAVWDVEVSADKTANLPETSGNSIWNPSRKVNSNVVKVDNDVDKLIFYRGLADFQVKLSVTNEDGVVTITNSSQQDIKGLTLLNHRADKNELIKIPELLANSKISVSLKSSQIGYQSFKGFAGFLSKAKSIIVKSLVKSGLFLDESKAMVGTWESGYFQTKGLRLLYVLPRVWTDEILPLKFSPSPKELVRTLVGRIEILTEKDELKLKEFAENIIAKGLVSSLDANGREMKGLGHFPEPKLRRILDLSITEELKAKVNNLITKMNQGFAN